MSRRTIILSDLHMGEPGRPTAYSIASLWHGYDHLVINGDLAEIHHPDHWRQAALETSELFEACDAKGVELTLLSGNHDAFLTDKRHLFLENDAVFVTHGDALHPAISPWAPATCVLAPAYAEALAALPDEERDSLEGRLAAAQHASLQEWNALRARNHRQTSVYSLAMQPSLIWRLLHYWMVMPRMVVEFVEQYGIDSPFVLVGHSHRPGLWRRSGRTIINTGSFGFPGTPRAVTIENGELALWRIVKRHERYALARRPMRRFTLPHNRGADQPASDEDVCDARASVVDEPATAA